jgi:tripartite-type tricarboxylate transporter receptor subunit TctC
MKRLVVLFLLAVSAVFPAAAQDYPTKTVTLLVPNAAGGPSDILARLMAPKLQEMWGQPVIVENRDGATGAIGTEFASRAAADGYTILFATSGPFGVLPAMKPDLAYDPQADFAPVISLGNATLVLAANKDVPLNSARELVEFAKANPKGLKLSVGGSNGLFISKAFVHQAGLDVIEVQYTGSAPSVSAMLGGEVDFTFTTPGAIKEHYEAGTAKLFGVSTAAPSSILPDIPTLKESGVPELANFDMGLWYGVFVPVATPADIVAKLNTDFNTVVAMPDVLDKMKGMGIEPTPGTPEEMAAVLDRDLKKYKEIVAATGMK